MKQRTDRLWFVFSKDPSVVEVTLVVVSGSWGVGMAAKVAEQVEAGGRLVGDWLERDLKETSGVLEMSHTLIQQSCVHR